MKVKKGSVQKKIWFRAKYYGWGWYPVTWQGWTIVLAYLIVVFGSFTITNSHSHSVSDTLYGFLPVLIVSTFLLAIICSLTGERPRWRWGN